MGALKAYLLVDTYKNYVYPLIAHCVQPLCSAVYNPSFLSCVCTPLFFCYVYPLVKLSCVCAPSHCSDMCAPVLPSCVYPGPHCYVICVHPSLSSYVNSPNCSAMCITSLLSYVFTISVLRRVYVYPSLPSRVPPHCSAVCSP